MIFDNQTLTASFQFIDGVKKTYKRSLIKEFYSQIMALTTLLEYQEKLDEIEKKALLKYFYFLLARKDYFSHELLKKGRDFGFYEHNCEIILDNLRNKRFIDDEKLKKKKELKKIKKGYSIKHTSLQNDENAKKEEAHSLKKLLQKKKNLILSSDLKERAKGYRFFISRGYDINQIKEQLQELEG